MLASEKKPKKDKEILFGFDVQTKDVRGQLSDQLRCLDARLDAHLGLLWELQDFYRRRAELELEYSKSLDRLVRQIMVRHKADKQKRELWPGYSTYTCWQYLLQSTRRASRDHACLAELYTSQMLTKLNDIADDVQRVYRKCRDIGSASHDEILKVLNELQNEMKTYHMYHGESLQAEAKLKEVQHSKSKVELTPKGTLSKKYRNYEKLIEKRQHKYSQSKVKALKSRNDYLLCLDSTNASIHKYFVEDLHNLVDCMDCGYHNAVQQCMLTHVSADNNVIKAQKDCVELLNKNVANLDQRSDKQKFLELYHQSFALPKKFEFQPHKGDEVRQISAQKPVQDELLDRLNQINNRLDQLKVENDEVWKTLESAESSLMLMINQNDYDVSSLFTEELKPPKSPHEHFKKRSDRMETEAFYIDKFQDFTFGSNLIARLQAKSAAITKALGDGGSDSGSSTGTLSRPPSLPPKPLKKQRRIGKAPLIGQPKLFGGSIEDYVEATNTEIPLVVRSCIRVINLYGMHHQGVFRVSGSQHEINDFKAAFEKGEDPLMETQDGRDINSVAGVLKLYFRELREPLFPTQYFDELMSYGQLETVPVCIHKVKELIASLSRPIFIVMRYLFSFLNHLSEYTDENMMDPYNIAICFGPTLLPIPPDRDQVQFQGSVIELVKNIIVHHEEIFPSEGGGQMYEKCIIEDDVDTVDSLDNLSDDEPDVEDNASEEDIFMEVEEQEATAQYDFTGRTDRELTFKKGMTLHVYTQVSSDWWKGELNGKHGLIPDKYIIIGSREPSETCDDDKRRSTESLPAKPFTLSPLIDADKSASQPNIATRLSTTSTDSSATRLSSTSTDSSGSKHDSPPGSVASKDSAYSMSSKETLDDDAEEEDKKHVVIEEEDEEEEEDDDDENDNDAEEEEEPNAATQLASSKSTEDLHNDIDRSLAEVMSNLQSLEMQQQHDTDDNKTAIVMHVSAKHTPDLVLDLPVSDEPASPKQRASPAAKKIPPADVDSLSTAEVFAKSNQSTIKKGQTLSVASTGGTARLQQLTGYAEGGGAMKRSATMPQREQTPPTPPRHERYSDPPIAAAAVEIVPEQVWQPQVAHVLQPPDRPLTPERSLTPERCDKPQLPSKPRPSPERGRPPPPLKAKPTVMRKPARAPEVLQKLRDRTLGSMDSNA